MSEKCPYFSKCGGCLYLDKDLKEYQQIKRHFIINAFIHQGINTCFNETIQIPFGHRRRATFVASKGILGFNVLKSHEIIPLDFCPALTNEINLFLPKLASFVKQTAFCGDISVLDTPYGIDIHFKELKIKQKTFKKTKPVGLSADMRIALADFMNQSNIARLLYDNEPIAQKVMLPFAPDSFLQPSLLGEQELTRLILSHLNEEKTVYDLFCGSGTFTKPLLKNGFQVLGFDISQDTVPCLKQYGVKRDLFRNPLLPEELNKADGIVMDPPRSGAKSQSEQLAKSQVSKIIMVSCNPLTAARDIKILIDGGYQLKEVTPVDQFIYTNHIELVALLTKI